MRTWNTARRNSFELKEWRFRVDIRNKLFIIRVVKYWHSLAREVVDSMEMLKARLGRAWRNLG